MLSWSCPARSDADAVKRPAKLPSKSLTAMRGFDARNRRKTAFGSF